MAKRVRIIGLISSIFLFSIPLTSLATHMPTPTDNNIHMSINGTEVTLPATNCVGSICTVDIGANSPYTVGTTVITIMKINTAYAARIIADDSTDLLLMRNVKITANTSSMTTIKFWRKFPAVGAPGSPVTWYYEARGGGKLLKSNNMGAPNARIVFRGSVEIPSGSSDVTLGGLTLPANCPTNQPQLKFCVPPGTPTSGQATFLWSPGYFRTTSQLNNIDRGHDRILTGYVELTLPSQANGDHLRLDETTTAGLQIQGNSSPGQTPDACDTCTGAECATCPNCETCPDGSQCLSCIKESEYWWFRKFLCWLGWGCPPCVIPEPGDGRRFPGLDKIEK